MPYHDVVLSPSVFTGRHIDKFYCADCDLASADAAYDPRHRADVEVSA